MRGVLKTLVALAVLAGAAGLYLTRPVGVDPAAYAGLTGDAGRGEQVFHASGCRSCHKSPDTPDSPALVGGAAFPSPFGTFHAPNISTDPTQGIGGWTLAQFANAVQRGVSPEGQHYYPAFPYTSYIRLTPQDVTDLWAYMQTLPADATPSKPHEVGFPFNIRRGLGLWKQLFLTEDWIVADAASDRGRYLVEAAAHCGECHTPRNAIGGTDLANWLAGAPNPSGRGTIPDIRPATLGWSAGDIAYYLESGFTPDFDNAGGHMADVVENMAKLPASDREAIAAYLLGL